LGSFGKKDRFGQSKIADIGRHLQPKVENNEKDTKDGSGR
jgi:hypothetical protein